MKKIKIGLLTTINTNIGDDFIREGVKSVLSRIFCDRKILYVEVNKHKPFTAYPVYNPVSLIELLPDRRRRFYPFLSQFISKLFSTKYDKCDLIINCGTPVIWNGCSYAEWAKVIWEHVFGRLSNKVPIMNLAAGSCYPFENQPKSFKDISENDAIYIKKISKIACLTTTRDVVAKKIFEESGEDISLLPCAAFISNFNVSIKNERNWFIINYMEGAGHYDFSQNIDKDKWEQIIKDVINKYRDKYKIVFLAHNKREFDISKIIDPTIPVCLPKTVEEYFSIISNGKIALCNRLHASIALAGLGIPSVSVGTDTRLMMVEQIGLPTFYVKDVTWEKLNEKIIYLENNYENEYIRLKNLQKETYLNYKVIIEKSLVNRKLLNPIY